MKYPSKEIGICVFFGLRFKEVMFHELHPLRDIVRQLGLTPCNYFGSILNDETKGWEFLGQLDANHPVGATNINDCAIPQHAPVKAVDHSSCIKARNVLEVLHGSFESFGTFGIFADFFIGTILHAMCEIEWLSHMSVLRH